MMLITKIKKTERNFKIFVILQTRANVVWKSRKSVSSIRSTFHLRTLINQLIKEEKKD